MALNEQFELAGKKPGLQVWRVEKMTLAPVPTEFYGDFYTGDSYILLNTISTSPALYNIHSWLGNRFKCSAHLKRAGFSLLSPADSSHVICYTQVRKLPRMREEPVPSSWPRWMTSWVESPDNSLSFKTRSQSLSWATLRPVSGTRWGETDLCATPC